MLRLPPGAEVEPTPHQEEGPCPISVLEGWINRLNEGRVRLVAIEQAALLRSADGARAILQEDEDFNRDEVERDIKDACQRVLDNWTAREVGHERGD